jgi:4-hydroxy-tetrahydrodipicolinate reductase
VTRILVIGHGRMGKLVEQHAAEHGCEVAGVVDLGQRIDTAGSFDVAIDFTVAEAVVANAKAVAALGRNLVIGTTGWQAHEAEVKAIAAQHNVGVLASANFSLGLNAFLLVAQEAARRFAPHADYGAWIHEAHHNKKKDAPSGTALLLQTSMVDAGYGGAIDVSSARVGSIPGTHTVGFDGPADTVTLTHTVRDRAVFAHGALEAAKWLSGRRGWFSMQDLLGDTQ